jgi:hypothetical protein
LNFLPVFLAAVFVAALAYFSPNANTNSDPRLGLLVSQAILQHHTVRMEVYEEAIAPIKDEAFVTYGGHTYYYFTLESIDELDVQRKFIWVSPAEVRFCAYNPSPAAGTGRFDVGCVLPRGLRGEA